MYTPTQAVRLYKNRNPKNSSGYNILTNTYNPKGYKYKKSKQTRL